METSTATVAPATAAPSSAAPVQPETIQPAAVAPEPKPFLGSADPAGKPVEPAKAEAKSEYDLKIKEGSGLTPADVEGIKAFATANKLSPEAAQAVLDRDATRAGEQAKVNAQGRIDAVRTWNAENERDPVIGGEKSPQMERVRQFVATHAEPELLKLLHNTGLGSHPGFLRFLVNASKGTGESTLAATGQPPATKKSLREVHFPNSPGMDRAE